MGRRVVRRGQVGLRQADAPPDHVLDGGIADAPLEHMRHVGLAASKGRSYLGEGDGLGVVNIQVAADTVRHFHVFLGARVNKGGLVQLLGDQEERQRQALRQGLSRGIGVQALIGALTELLQKVELHARRADRMAVGGNDMIGGKRFKFQPEVGEAVGADLRMGDAADLMGLILIVEEDIALLDGEGVVPDGIGAEAPVD